MKTGAPGSFGAYLKGLRVTAGFTQEELATNAGLSVHAVSALERGERRRPHMETIRALASALGLKDAARDALVTAARAQADETVFDELSAFPLPVACPASMTCSRTTAGAISPGSARTRMARVGTALTRAASISSRL